MKPRSLQKFIPRLIHPVFETKRVQPGAPPGTLVSHPDRPQPEIHVIAYRGEEILEQTLATVSEVPALLKKWSVVWINVNGLGDAEVVRELGEVFGLHALALEDVLNIPQRPKVEVDLDKVFFIARMPTPGHETHAGLEQVSLFWGKKFVLTFQERPGDVFDPVRQRICGARGRRTRPAADYLAYTLIDAVIDSYFPLLEAHGETLAEVEAMILAGDQKHSVGRVYRMKRELLTIRRAMWPQRDALQALYREPTDAVGEETLVHLRDCMDHCNHIIDLLENYREISASLLDLYLSMTSQRMNEIMKVLTIIATIFIPLTFIAGIYGMNFDPEASPWNMPELEWAYGYPAVMLLMFGIAMAMVFYFWRKGWLGPEMSIGKPDEDGPAE